MNVKKCAVVLLVMVVALTGVWAGGAKSNAGGGKPEVNLWTSGSDNVRLIFEKLVDEFNKDPEYSKICTLKLQYMPSGGGNQSIMNRVLAAYQSGQKDTNFDVVEFGEA